MSTDLRSVLHGTTPEDLPPLDVRDLQRRGVRRRRAKRTVTAVAAVAVIAAGSVSVLGLPRPALEIAGERPGGDRVAEAAGTWTPLPEAPLEARERPLVATDGARTVLLGGRLDRHTEIDGTTYLEVEAQDGAVFDADTGSWTAVPPHPLPPVSGPQVALAGDRLALVGGRRLSAVPGGGVAGAGAGVGVGDQLTLRAAVYDLAERTWTDVGAPPELDERTPDLVRWRGEELVVFGGSDDDGRGHLDGAVWSPARGWVPIPPAPLTPRAGAGVAVTGTRLVVWGGTRDLETTETADLLADGAVYDLVAGTWSVLPDAPLDARWIGHDGWPYRENLRVDGERVLVAGGAGTGATQHLDGAWLDLDAGTWEQITPAPEQARFVTAQRGGLLAVDDDTGPGGYVTLWRYDEGADTWERTATRLTTSLEVVELTPERIVLTSTGDDGRWQDSPRIGLWTSGEDALVHTQPPLSGRTMAAVAPLPDGVVVWGGRAIETRGEEGVDSALVADGARLQP